MFDTSQIERALQLISTTQASFLDFVTVRAQLALTYCNTATLTKCPEKRLHLLTLARQALTAAENYMQLTPGTHTDLWEAAARLRSAIAQLENNPQPVSTGPRPLSVLTVTVHA